MGFRILLCILALVASANLAPAAELRAIDTRHYRINTDLDRELATDISRRMDAMYDEYARRLAAFQPADDVPKLEAYLFAKQKDYLAFTGEKLHNTGGVYIPRRNLLAAFLEGQGRDGLRRTLQHEAFHQFAYNAISKELPVWLNEGMAQLFEEAIWTGEGFWLGHIAPRRVRQIQNDLTKGKLIPFEKMLPMSQDEWATNLGNDGDLGATQYNQAWAMVHFLTFVADDKGQPIHRARLINMLRLLHEGKDADAAFKEAFSPNIKGFQDRFVEFGRSLEPTPTATIIERQGVLGDLYSELIKRGMKFANITQFKRAAVAGGYRMHYTKGELSWETEKDLKVYFSDMAGRALSPEQLYFEARPGAPLPDIVCRCHDDYQLRTRFHKSGDRFEHEVAVEKPGTRVARELGRAE
ncbi:DUF1570 domain-containing protein [Humisphaera borealis]|uniref:DUF1570 domain-containing protein n=1 Tax=Humisphaera borealis TaxID=2807512 RepID=A0A7M2WVT6_9BACT|nr:DUF1570 domain-containing protein [Humisphaera borealis]QOV89499.1 DUF1570 domain-containing protein [Humisphaera borealis]